MKFKVSNKTFEIMTEHVKVEKPDPNGNRQQRRAAKKMMMKGKKK